MHFMLDMTKIRYIYLGIVS